MKSVSKKRLQDQKLNTKDSVQIPLRQEYLLNFDPVVK